MRPDLVQAICFDIGGTLVQMERGTLATEIAITIGADRSLVRDLLIEHGKRRRTTPSQLGALVTKGCGHPEAAGRVTGLLEQRRRDMLQPAMFTETVEVLQTVSDLGWRIFYLSNAVGYTNMTSEPAYYAYAEAIFHSWQLGCCTPNPAAFKAVTTASGLAPHAMLHVGDSWDADISGALAAGWQAIHVDRAANAPSKEAERLGVPVVPDLRGVVTLLPRLAKDQRSS